jgi:hypothetical protein
MTRPELEQRLIELERDIEKSKTAQWLAEFEREQLRFELRRLAHVESTQTKKITPEIPR